jgi:putative transposase
VVVLSSVLCKHCHSASTRKYGFVEGVQTYYCNNCNRKFRADDHLFRMKTPCLQVASALEDYYTGKSINRFRGSFIARFGNSPPSSKTIYVWITRFTSGVVNQFEDYHPKVGPVWIASETIASVSGMHYCCLDIVDRDTRFLMATQLSVNRRADDIKNLMVQAVDRAQKCPDRLLIGTWNEYGEGIKLTFRIDSKRIDVGPIVETDQAEFLEYWHSTVKFRTRTLKGLKSADTAHKFLEGFRIWYNYLRPQECLNGKTPAEKAEVTYSSRSWGDVLQAIKPQIQSSKQT